LVAQPLTVWMLALVLGLPTLQTQVAVLLGSVATGANVYLMANRFEALRTPIATAILISTALSALTTPLTLTLVGA
jgi:predicted permease